MPTLDRVRKSGKTGANEAAEEAAEELLAEPDNDLPEEDARYGRLSFSRMRIDWTKEDVMQMTALRIAVDQKLQEDFAGAYAVMFDLYVLVREQEVDEKTGEFRKDINGLPVWKRTRSGAPIEDWTRLTSREKENFLFRITTQVFEWSQYSANLWAESMFAKAEWTEAHAIGYTEGIGGTVDDRTAHANRKSAEERYFAVYMAAISRKAEAIVRSMEMLSRRLAETLQS